MALSNKLIDQFVNVVGVDSKTHLKSNAPLYGTIVGHGGTNYVRLDGSDVLTPIISTVSYEEGERVLVNILKHTATVIGNVSSPSPSGSVVKEVNDKVDTIVADNAVIRDKITASEAEISAIKADNVSITGKLEATNATIENLKATVITADQADLKYATIENLNATNATIRNLQSDYGSFKEVTTDKITAAEGNITNLTSENVTITGRLDANEASIKTLEAGTAKIEDLDAVNAHITNLDADIARIDTLTANKADIDLANVNNAWIQNGVIKDGSIGTAAISDGAITNAQIADATIEAAKIKSINADTITAGTIKTDRLIITSDDGSESIVKVINESNGVTTAEADGSKIQAASIDVIDLSAFEATIAGFTMSQNAIYDGKTSIKDSTSGIYISTTGMGIGNGALTGKNESPIQMYSDGSFKLVGKNGNLDFNTVTGALDINVTNLTIGSKSVITSDELDSVENKATASMFIRSNNGTWFDNTNESTMCTVYVRCNGVNLTDMSKIQSKFGSNAVLEWSYSKNGGTTWTIINSTDSKITNNGFRYTYTPSSTDSNVDIKCILKTDSVICESIISLMYSEVLENIVRYYKLQSASSSAPAKPTDGQSIPSGWSKTEPTYVAGSDNSLYYVDQNTTTDGAITYSQVYKSSSYEAAKSAYILADSHDARLTQAETNISSNSSQIELKASQTEVTNLSDTVNGYITKDTKFTQDANGWMMEWDTLINTDEADIENHQDYITFQNGDIELGESGSDLKVKISNNIVQFKGESQTEVTPDLDATAWITGQQFNINRGEIHEYLRVGPVVFVPKKNGNFSIDIL